MALIYVITNKINGKQYVGATKFSLKKRFKEHCNDSKKFDYDYSKRPMYIDMNQYGIDNFVIEELEECSDEDRFERECYWIEKLNTYNNGYNLTYGGSGKQFYNYKEIADKYMELKSICDVAAFFNCAKETVVAACKKYRIKTLSSQEIHKIKDSIKIQMLDKATNDILNEFESISMASRALNKGKGGINHIGDACKGKRKTAYGYKWRYVEDECISD